METNDSHLVEGNQVEVIEHWRGCPNAMVTLIKYGDYQCPQCRGMSQIIDDLVMEFKDHQLKFVFKHFPVTQIHPRAEKAAEAAEAAGEQGLFWEMHELLFANQKKLSDADLVEYAATLNLDIPKFLKALSERRYLKKVLADLMSGVENGVCGTPTFFINDNLFDFAFNVDVLRTEILLAFERKKAEDI